jgi:hypothetical protein
MIAKSKLALVSLILGIFSFVHLLGIEKAALAIVFGTWALKETFDDSKSRKTAWIGITLGLLYLVVMTVLIIFHFPKLISLLGRLK